MADDNSALLAAGGALGGSVLTFLGHWVNGWFKRKETREQLAAQTAQTMSQTVDAKLKTLMEGYEKRIDDLTGETKSLKDQVTTQDQHIGLLTCHILTLTKLLSKTGIIVPPLPELGDEALDSGIPTD